MKNYSGYVSEIESMGLVDGPGVRTVIFLSGCKLRCLFCHNPEMWVKCGKKYKPKEIVNIVLRNKPYFGQTGGVTFSGGEPLLQTKFIKKTFSLLKKEKINIALDTSGVGIGHYNEILSLVDLIILDIKHINSDGYKMITDFDIDECEKFISAMNDSGKDVWIRQVIIPGINDNYEYIDGLVKYVKKIKNVKKIEFLPFHHLGFYKYEKLKYSNPLLYVAEMDKDRCGELYKVFIKKYNGN